MNDSAQTLGLAPSFGFGDRLGLATPGHVQALQRAGGAIRPIFAQQSIREMVRTCRTPQQVMDDARRGAKSVGYAGMMGADADHLKTPDDVDRTAAAGFVFFTIDPSDHVDPGADACPPAELARRARSGADVAPWAQQYAGRSVPLPNGAVLELGEDACLRAALKYGRAVHHALRLARHINRVMQAGGREYEIELSVDETPHPTTLAEHYIVADQCLRGGMKLVSLAPRFVGELEKGVDYKGDLGAFERSLQDHAAIAELLGPYKLSLHSGSDKLTIYPVLARCTRGRYHVKTAGTSYLEALRVLARHDERLFRRVIEFARAHYESDRATYHVSATLESVPPPADVQDSAHLEALYLGRWQDVPPGRGFTQPGRQILHCTFGSVLTDPVLGDELHSVLASHPDTYRELLAHHFQRHLEALQGGWPV